jgi:hypothetical protein
MKPVAISGIKRREYLKDKINELAMHIKRKNVGDIPKHYLVYRCETE